MIFNFSGTGNSLWVAKQISNSFSESIVSISEELLSKNNNFNYELKENEKIFFTFPVHSWGPAVLVLRFIKKISFKNYNENPVYIVCTCGDHCGYTFKIIARPLKKKKIKLTKYFSIQMPNNYILMSGFNTDPKEIEKQKLDKAPELIKEIVDNIKENNGKIIYTTGTKPFLKSYIVYPLFRKFVLGKNSFYAKDTCTSCKLCAKVCPTKTISFENKRPKWGNDCVQCVACIHRCPPKAIEYGNISQNKGRYYNPNV